VVMGDSAPSRSIMGGAEARPDIGPCRPAPMMLGGNRRPACAPPPWSRWQRKVPFCQPPDQLAVTDAVVPAVADPA